MNFCTIQPSIKLSPYVISFWVLEVSVSPKRPWIHRTLATYCPELVFHYKGPFEELTYSENLEKSFITGIHAQTDRIRRFIVKEDFGIFGVFLQPYAIPTLFNIPSSEIMNELPDLVTLLGQEGKDLTDKMLFALDNNERMRIITDFLEDRVDEFERPEIIAATRSIYNSNGQVKAKDLAEESGLSQRQFERKFKEFNGFSPKSFARLVRFKRLTDSSLKKYKSLTQMAYDFGYYDQAHFIQDFKQFSGYNPKAYFSGQAHEVFYSPLTDEEFFQFP